MKPSKIRNRTIHKPDRRTRSRLMVCHLSSDLRKTHKRRSMRVVPGDSVLVKRGLYRDVPGKVDKVIPGRGVVISGTKKEKTAGDAYDVYINPSNMIITSLDTGDSWRASKLKKEKSKPATSQERESDDAQKIAHQPSTATSQGSESDNISETAKTRTDSDTDDSLDDDDETKKKSDAEELSR